MTTDNYNENATDRRDERGYHDPKAATPQAIRKVFGIFMIVVYVTMGILLITGYFGLKPEFNVVRYGGGVLLILYGIWRGYRQFKGID